MDFSAKTNGFFRTKVILRHSSLTEDDREKYNEHSQGWIWFVNRLGNYLTKGES